MFKSVALSTLANLYNLYKEHQPLIIDKALTVLFSEFSYKGDSSVSEKDLFALVSDVIKTRV